MLAYIVKNNKEAKDVYCKVEGNCESIYIPSGESNKFRVKAELSMIAIYYNEDWKMEEGKTGYFIGKLLGESPTIMKHSSAKYEGITYFKNREDAKKAMELLKDEIKYLL